MNLRCPDCKYDLVGLGRYTSPRCPECGADIETATPARTWQRKLTRRWVLFYISPILALPGVFAMGIGQPIAAFILCTLFCRWAMRLDGELYGNAETGLSLMLTSIAVSTTYTVLTAVVFAIFFAFVIA